MSSSHFPLIFAVLTAGALVTAHAAGQDSAATGGVCLNHPLPGPACSAIVLTNVGGYFRTAGAYESHFRAIADWGVLLPVGSRSAIGASMFLSLDSDDFSYGPAIRYRHWSANTKSSWEAAVGVPINNQQSLAHGLFKWNSSRLVGFVVRPELRRTFTYDPYQGCFGPPYNCDTRGTSFAMSFGVELGGFPGLALAAASAAGLLAVVVAIAGSDN